MEIIFNSEEELYKRLLPALKSRKKILSKTGYSYISEQDIWNALSTNKWNKDINLELCDMVDDILHIEDKFLSNYYHKINPNELMIIDDIELPKLK